MKTTIISALFITLLVSCASVQKTTIDTVGSIAQPDIRFSLHVNLDQSNIQILGPIDETIKLERSQQSPQMSFVGRSETLVKRVYIANLIAHDEGIAQLRNQNPTYFDLAISELAGRCLAKYPELDYILFPKIQLEFSGSSSLIGSHVSYYKLRLTGEAVKLQL
ncbi:MAG: hypothetical protein AB7T74_06140 [Clostridia bacterium]|jgi:hypothetical protein|nr:hypothetical protein [Spirochaetia bacterium]